MRELWQSVGKSWILLPLSHILDISICNDLSDDADLKAKSRQMYGKSNTLRQKFHMCSTAVKVKLFTAYFSNVDMCALWVNYRQTAFHQFKVAYNNSYLILNRLPMRCTASGMFASDNVNSSTCVIRRSIYWVSYWLSERVSECVLGGCPCVCVYIFILLIYTIIWKPVQFVLTQTPCDICTDIMCNGVMRQVD